MKTPAVIASLTVVGSIAYASGQQESVGMPPPATALRLTTSQSDGVASHSADTSPPSSSADAAAASLLTDCDQSPQPWFEQTPREVLMCNGGSTSDIGKCPRGAADVNADGRVDYFDFPDGGGVTAIYYGYGGQIGGTAIYFSSTAEFPNGIRVIRSSVLEIGASAAAALQSMRGNAIRLAIVTATGWRDMDNDGDLDLVCDVAWQAFGVNGEWHFDVWFKNIGFQRSSGIVGDLNNDLKVDGFDLALLLANWQN